MLIGDNSVFLYHYTLKQASSALTSHAGQFLGGKSQEIVLVTASTLELWSSDPSTGKLDKISSQNAFGIVQNAAVIRPVGSSKDMLVVTSDSGKIVVLEYHEPSKQFIPVVQEPHSKNGLRRLTPGEYLCVDPQHRAIMVGAIERNKFVYKVESVDGSFKLSSPLEATSKNVLTLAMCALDTRFDNPTFAALEIDYSAYSSDEYDPHTSPVQLNFYELDQGLNHVVKKKGSAVPASANHLVPLPGFIGGVLVCCENSVIYETVNGRNLYLPIPRRTNEKSIILSSITHRLKKNNFFILLQNSLGDLFKLTFDFNDAKEVLENITIKYFDTVPPSANLNVLKSGFLFTNTIRNNKMFYQFEKLGDEVDDSTIHSKDFETLEQASEYATPFKPKGLDNLALVFFIETLNPIVDAALVEISTDDSPDPLKQLVTLSSHSYLKTLSHGIATSTIVSSPLPLVPTSIHTCKLFKDSLNDDYLVISSTASFQTLVLSIGEVVEEVTDSMFKTDQPTVAVQQVGKSSLVQIYTNGIKHIRHIKKDDGSVEKTATDWFPPAGISIVRASTNNEQVVIGLSNQELCYFEVDPSDDQLIEYQERLEVNGGAINSLAISASFLNKSQVKSSFAVVGCADETVQVVSLQQHNCLEVVSLQALSSNSTSIVMLPTDSATLVHIGMENGLYVRTTIDEVSGALSDTRVKYLGSRPVHLSVIGLPMLNQNAVLAISSRPWIGYENKGNFKVTPLKDINIGNGSSFYSEDIGGEGIVAYSGGDLIIFTLGSSDEDEGFNVNNDLSLSSLKLRYSPKSMCVHVTKDKKFIYTLQCERNIKSPYSPTLPEAPKKEDAAVDEDYIEAFGYETEISSSSSCVQVVDFLEQEIIQTIEFPRNESALCFCQTDFNGPESHLVVATAAELSFLPSSYSGCYIYTFKIERGSLSFLHKTEVDKLPTSMTAYENKILVGMGNHLRIYDLGQKQLLRKSSSLVDSARSIVKILNQGQGRVVLGDAANSTIFARFDTETNTFIAFSDDTLKRQITSLEALDFDTVVGGDKFGNFFVNRLPKTVSERAEEDWNLLKYQEPILNASSTRLQSSCEIFLNDIVTSCLKGSLVAGGKESIIYTGLEGSVGVFTPISTKKEVEFFMTLELELRKFFDFNFDDFDKKKQGYNILGKDHLKYRSYYNSVRNIVDGDLLDRFFEIDVMNKIKISNKLNKSPKEIEKRINEIRERSAF